MIIPLVRLIHAYTAGAMEYGFVSFSMVSQWSKIHGQSNAIHCILNAISMEYAQSIGIASLIRSIVFRSRCDSIRFQWNPIIRLSQWTTVIHKCTRSRWRLSRSIHEYKACTMEYGFAFILKAICLRSSVSIM